MMLIKTFFRAIGLTLVVSCTLIAQNKIKVDVCIYGGTSPGVIAAYTAQKLGKTALLIEPGKHLGGMSSGGLGFTDIGNKYAITGLARDFYRRVGSHYGKFEQWTFEPHVAEDIFKDYVTRGNFRVLYENRLKDVRKEGNRITAIVLENASNPSLPNTIIEAKMFMDCGYEGDLMAKAGVQYAVGREANADFDETINGVQVQEGHQFPEGIDPYKTPGNPASGLLWGISAAPLLPTGSGDKSVQAYNYRICLSTNPANQVAITKPEGYDSSRYELLLRLFKATPKKRTLNDYFIVSRMPNQKTDINNRGGFSTDMIGMNHDYPEADYARRDAIVSAHETYTKGLLYFYGHDSRVPVELRTEMLKYGYPKDEYTDHGNWSPQLYVREARRMVGHYVMHQANCQGKVVVQDGVGMAAYTMDSHNCQRVVVNGMVRNEGNVEVGGFGPYPIAYGAIVPKAAQCGNLFVPVCLSATHIAYGSIRMEPVFMVLAQSSAVAAAMAIDGKTDIQAIDVAKLQQHLKANPLADGTIMDVLVDNDDAGSATKKGSWTSEAKGGYGPSFLRLEATPSSPESTVRFVPDIPKQGVYTAYAYFPKVNGLSPQTLVTVNDGKNKKEIVVKSSDIIVEGQTSGEWVSLGDYTLAKGKNASVEISTRGANGVVVADAIIFLPARVNK